MPTLQLLGTNRGGQDIGGLGKTLAKILAGVEGFGITPQNVLVTEQPRVATGLCTRLQVRVTDLFDKPERTQGVLDATTRLLHAAVEAHLEKDASYDSCDVLLRTINAGRTAYYAGEA